MSFKSYRRLYVAIHRIDDTLKHEEQIIISNHTGISRRRFIMASLSAAGGLAIGISIPGVGRAMPMGPTAWDKEKAADASELNAWIVIDPDDSVTIRMGRGEMGQGVFTSMSMIVAEELGCDWTKVRAEYASGHRNAVEKGVYKGMFTGGSSSIRGSRAYLQQAGASARVRLIQAAAARWNVPVAECQAAGGIVAHGPSKRSLGYGALAADAAKITLTTEPAIKKPGEFTLIGKSTARLDTRVKVNGQAVFGIDVRVPDMLYAAVVTCPVPGGAVKNHDEKPILALRGVTNIVPIPGGLAIVADSFWRAKKAADAIRIEWDYGAGTGTNSAQFRKDYLAALDGPVSNAKTVGDVDAAFKTGKVIEAVYEAPHLAHATMEPLNCTAHVRDGRVDIWLGTQTADGVIATAAKTLDVPPETIFLHNCYIGGGFGRRSVTDETAQAVVIAKAVGKPVKMIWSREIDMRHDRYRPQAAMRLKAKLNPDGTLNAFYARTAVGSLSVSLGTPGVKNGVEGAAVEGFVDLPYATPNLKVDCFLKNTHIPVMYWRSVGASQNAFAIEGFIDELAHAAGMDGYRYRRMMLKDKPKYLAVLDRLAEKSDWDKKLPPGWGRGMAVFEQYDTIVAECAEVSVDSQGKVKCERVVVVVDCCNVVNPLNVEMQMESGVIYGLCAAMFNEITVKDGMVEQGNFDSYQIVRFADAPKIETHFALSGGDKWGGIGEPGVPPIAPALCNAIFAATGHRIRSLPVRNTDLRGQAKV